MHPVLSIVERYSAISAAPILNLHRHQDGYIAFATERDGEDFRPLVAIRASELETYFPQFRDQLLKDAYVGINADWRLRSFGEDGHSYGYPLHRSDKLRYINASYVDIDFYRLNLDLGTVIGRKSGQLPPATMIVKSGRGLWLLWLICDPKSPEHQQRAFTDTLDLYSRVQRAIIERLMNLGADTGATDATRHIRLAGSLNTESETTVQWWIQGESQSGYIYTLPQLAKFFRVEPAKRHKCELVAHNPAKRRGHVALNAGRLEDFNMLRGLRGGFSEGCRNNAAKIYSWLLRANRCPRYDLPGKLAMFGAECHPGLSKAEIKAAWKYTKLRWMKNQTISDWLGVTKAESEVLKRFPPASQFRTGNEPPPGPRPRDAQRQAVQNRRFIITEIIADLGRVPPLRKMAEAINGMGFMGNHQTVFKDYKALGIQSKRAAKPATGQQTLSLYCMQESVDKKPVSENVQVPGLVEVA
jgi:hypothetical protein